MKNRKAVLARYLDEPIEALIQSSYDNHLFEVSPFTQHEGPTPEEAVSKVKELKEKLQAHFTDDPAIESVEDMLAYGKSKQREVALIMASDHPRFITFMADEKTNPIEYQEELEHNTRLFETMLRMYDASPCAIAYRKFKAPLSTTEEQNTLFHILSDDDHWHNYAYRQAYNEQPIDKSRRRYWPSNEGEYLVLTDKEANAKAGEYILDSLWAFNASFLQYYLRGDLDEKTITTLQERCEDANPALLALVKNKKDLVDDAISADGRGHFLNTYDGEENEAEGYFIYRMN